MPKICATRCRPEVPVSAGISPRGAITAGIDPGALPHLAIRNDTDYITTKHGLKTAPAQRIFDPFFIYVDKL